MGYLLSTLFTVTLLNTHSQSVSVEYQLESPPLTIPGEQQMMVKEVSRQSAPTPGGGGGEGYGRGDKPSPSSSSIRRALHTNTPSGRTHTAYSRIAAGQTTTLSLELLPLVSATPSTSTRKKQPTSAQRGATNPPIFLSCRTGRPYTLVVVPSVGPPIRTAMEFRCRSVNQSLLVSYLDHDNSVSHAAIVFPIVHRISPPLVVSESSPRPATPANNGKTCEESEEGYCDDVSAEHRQLSSPPLPHYPVLLALHASWSSTDSYIDTFRWWVQTSHDANGGLWEFQQGVPQHFIVAPQQRGAPAWASSSGAGGGAGGDAVFDGASTQAMASIQCVMALQQMLQSPHIVLPRIALDSPGILTGPRKAGVWTTAMNRPDSFSCFAPMQGGRGVASPSSLHQLAFNKQLAYQYNYRSSWSGNSEGPLDAALLAVLQHTGEQQRMEHHVSNLQHLHTHMRIDGSTSTRIADSSGEDEDLVLSRRMHRLLMQQGIGVGEGGSSGSSTIDEVGSGGMRGHWWWGDDDNKNATTSSNSNRNSHSNEPLNTFYQRCFRSSYIQSKRRGQYLRFLMRVSEKIKRWEDSGMSSDTCTIETTAQGTGRGEGTDYCAPRQPDLYHWWLAHFHSLPTAPLGSKTNSDGTIAGNSTGEDRESNSRERERERARERERERAAATTMKKPSLQELWRSDVEQEESSSSTSSSSSLSSSSSSITSSSSLTSSSTVTPSLLLSQQGLPILPSDEHADEDMYTAGGTETAFNTHLDSDDSSSDTGLCSSPFFLSVTSPASQAGRCGVTVQHQTLVGKRSSVKVTCTSSFIPSSTPSSSPSSTPSSSPPSSPSSSPSAIDPYLLRATRIPLYRRVCEVSTSNVLRLRLHLGYETALFGCDTVSVDGRQIVLSELHKFGTVKEEEEGAEAGVVNETATKAKTDREGEEVDDIKTDSTAVTLLRNFDYLIEDDKGGGQATMEVRSRFIDMCWQRRRPSGGERDWAGPHLCARPVDPLREKTSVRRRRRRRRKRRKRRKRRRRRRRRRRLVPPSTMYFIHDSTIITYPSLPFPPLPSPRLTTDPWRGCTMGGSCSWSTAPLTTISNCASPSR